LAHANSTYEQRNERTERTQAQHANTDGTGELAYSQNSGDVWRNWLMGFAEEEHLNRRGQSNGRREWWQVEPNVGRVADGVAYRVDRLKAIGNGQVPLCAATAFRILSKDI
jgi:DNA (cytosine-5)-methyltransferase 1